MDPEPENPLPVPPSPHAFSEINESLFTQYKKEVEDFRISLKASGAKQTEIYRTASLLLQELKKDLELISRGEQPTNYKKFYISVPLRRVYTQQEYLENPKIIKSIPGFELISRNPNALSIGVVNLSCERNSEIDQCPLCREKGFSDFKNFRKHCLMVHSVPETYKTRKAPWNSHGDPSDRYDLADLARIPDSISEAEISEQVHSNYLENRPPQDRNSFYKDITSYLTKKLESTLKGFRIMIYGSSMNGFGTLNSDMDLSIKLDRLANAFPEMTGEEFNERIAAFSDSPKAANTLLDSIIFGKILKVLVDIRMPNIGWRPGARVQIISFSTETDPPVEIDLSIMNELGIENTNLLYAYSQIDERVPQLGLAVKMWAKARGIANPQERTLSSYTYIILLISFLQSIKILPYLQQVNVPRKMKDNYDCTFDSSVKKYQDAAMHNRHSTGFLLFEFFRNYSVFDWANVVVSISENSTIRSASNWAGSKMIIKDPFDTDRNLGDICDGRGKIKIKSEFRRAFSMLKQGNTFLNILQ